MMIEILLTIPAVISLLLAAFFALEIFAGLAPQRKTETSAPDSVAVVIPAHNESAGISPTLEDVKEQLRANDRVIVVADNCTDNTADIARAGGAHCIERQDATRRGKGYALQAALDHLRAIPPAVVYFIDADCRLDAGALGKVAGAAHRHQRPAQGLTLMQAPADASPVMRVAEFAWVVMNRARMGGLYRIFGVTRLTGTGMALPWPLAADLDLGSGDIVEDLSLSLTMTEQGRPPIFVSDAVSRGVFPSKEEAGAKQRARWEQGSINAARRKAVPLFFRGAHRGDIRLLALASDTAIPPLTVFLMLLTALCVAAFPLVFFNIWAPLIVSVAALLIFFLSLGAAWFRWGRAVLPLSSCGDLVRYILFKRKVYGGEARRSTATWTRTERDAPPRDGGGP